MAEDPTPTRGPGHGRPEADAAAPGGVRRRPPTTTVRVDVPVLVVGGGPVGLLTSILLTGHGVTNLVAERRAEVQAAPAAHVVNARTFEILHQAGVDRDRLADACRAPEDGAWVRWVTRLAGDELGCVPFERQDRLESLHHVTPSPLRNLSQHRLEPILRDHVQDLACGVEWQSSRPESDGVVSTLREVATGTTIEVRSRWVVAADGAGSPVRRQAGIAMDGPARLVAFLSIHAEVDLRSVAGERPATIYWVMDPDVGGAFVAHDTGRTWVYMHEWDPDTEDLADYTPERCAELFRRAAGIDDLELAVRTVTPWSMTSQVAERYRDDRVLLVGDAAHRFPPTGGLGLNTGAADAQNLAWKLAAVEHGWAGPGLLDTYEAERRPVAVANAEQSLVNALRLTEVAVAVGTMDDDPEVARAGFAATMADDEGRARAACEAQAGHFDMLGLQLGSAYPSDGGAVVDDGSPMVEVDDPVRHYVPDHRPGGRLPHVWADRHGSVCSTLDLVAPGRFLLMTADHDWATAGGKVAADGPVPLDVVHVGVDVHPADDARPLLGDLPPTGALLVRPDQHVAWRTTCADGDLRAELAGVLTTVVSGQ